MWQARLRQYRSTHHGATLKEAMIACARQYRSAHGSPSSTESQSPDSVFATPRSRVPRFHPLSQVIDRIKSLSRAIHVNNPGKVGYYAKGTDVHGNVIYCRSIAMFPIKLQGDGTNPFFTLNVFNGRLAQLPSSRQIRTDRDIAEVLKNPNPPSPPPRQGRSGLAQFGHNASPVE